MTGPNSTSAWLGLGGNVGRPRAAMAAALQALDAGQDVAVSAVSSLYRTPPWGVAEQPDFLNAVARLETTLSARALLERCLDIERSLKRERGERWGPRTIDMDLLVFGREEIDEEGLRVPHPRMAERSFVMLPLAEISPGLTVDRLPASERAAALGTAGITRVAGPDWWRAGQGPDQLPVG